MANKRGTFKYLRIKKPAPMPSGTFRNPIHKEVEQFTGFIDGLKAAKGEENLFNAAYATGLVIAHQFRLAVGAPRNKPGWKELDFLFTTRSGQYAAVQVKDYEFVHHGVASEDSDEANDAYMQAELLKKGILLKGGRIISVNANDLATFDGAKKVAEGILVEKMTKKLVPVEGRELQGSPLAGIVGDEIMYTVDLGSICTVDSNCWQHAFKGTTDVSADVLSGAMSANGNIVTLKMISGEVAAEYRYTFKILLKGNYVVFYFRRRVEKESGSK